MQTEEIQKHILYEDKEILVCHKPAGLAVQNAKTGTMDMECALKNYLAAGRPGTLPYLGIVHRLDQPVEGVLVFARTPRAAKELSRQMAAGQMNKLYLAVTRGTPPKEEDTLEDYLKKDGKTNTSYVTEPGVPGSRRARLSYRVLEAVEEETKGEKKYLLRIRLETGRHHQIRVQMSHAGMPLAGDRKYGNIVGKAASAGNGSAGDGKGWKYGNIVGKAASAGNGSAGDGKGRNYGNVGNAGAAGTLGLCAESLTFIHPALKKEMTFRTVPRGEQFQGFSKNV